MFQEKFKDDATYNVFSSPPHSYSVLVCLFFWLSLHELKSTFQVVQHQIRVVAAVRGCLLLASGRLTDQNSWNPSCNPDSPGKHWRPREATESHCAAVRCVALSLHGFLGSDPWLFSSRVLGSHSLAVFLYFHHLSTDHSSRSTQMN